MFDWRRFSLRSWLISLSWGHVLNRCIDRVSHGGHGATEALSVNHSVITVASVRAFLPLASCADVTL